MQEGFTHSLGVTLRSSRSRPGSKFSPSFGVHQGLIKDPNWPPAMIPENGNGASRRFRRVEFSFGVDLRGETFWVHGDISQGGAMFFLKHKVEAKVVDVVVKGRFARAEVLSTSARGSSLAYHCRFLDTDEAKSVWEAVASS